MFKNLTNRVSINAYDVNTVDLIFTNMTSSYGQIESLTVGSLHVTDASTFENIDIEKLIAERATINSFVLVNSSSMHNVNITHLNSPGATITNLLTTNITNTNNLIVSGNVGIGTATPSSKLNVSGGNICISNNVARIALQNSTTGSNINSDGLQLVQDGVNAYLINYEPNQILHIANNGQNAISIRSTGNVAIGNSTIQNLVTTTLTSPNIVNTNLTNTNLRSTSSSIINLRFDNLVSNGSLKFNTSGELVIGIDNKTLKLDEANRELYSDALSFVKGWDPIDIYTADNLASFLGISLAQLAVLLGLPENLLPNFIFVKLDYDDEYFTTSSGKLTLTGGITNNQILFKDNNILNGMDNLKADVVTGTTTISNLKSLESTIDYIEGVDVYYTNSTLTNIISNEATVDYIEGDNIYYTNSTLTNIKVLESTVDYIEGDNLYYTNSTLTNIISNEATIDYIEGDNIYYTNSTLSNIKHTGSATLGNLDIFSIDALLQLKCEGNATITNLKSSESTIDYIEGDNLYYTNSTITNALVTSITTSNIKSSNINTTSLTSSNINSSNITTGSILVTSITSSNAIITNLTSSNLISSNISSNNINANYFYTQNTTPSSSSELTSKAYVDSLQLIEDRGIKIGSDKKISIDIASTPLTGGIVISNDLLSNAKLINLDGGLKSQIDQLVIGNTIPIPNALAVGLSNQLLVYLYIGVSVSLVTVTASVTGLVATTETFRSIIDNTAGDVFNSGGQFIISPTKVIYFNTGINSPNNNTLGNIVNSNITSTNALVTSLTASNLAFSSVSAASGTATIGNIKSSNIISDNTLVTSLTASNILVGELKAISNTNTIGSIFTTGGNVGINTTAPTSRLNVSGGNICISNNVARIALQNSTTGSNINSDGLQLVQDGVNAYLINYEPNQILHIANNGQNAISIRSTGNVAIGNSTITNLLTTTLSSPNLVNTNITSTNALATSLTATNLGFTTLSAASATATIGNLVNSAMTTTSLLTTNLGFTTLSAASGTATIGNLVSSDILATNITATNITVLNLSAINETVTNMITVNESIQNLIVSNDVQISDNLIALGNSNTIGSIFTTGGNVGIGTTSPNVELTVIAPGSTLNPTSSGLVEFRGSQTNTVGESILRLGRGHHSGFYWASSAEFNIRRQFDYFTNAVSAMDIRLGLGESDNPDTNVMTLVATGAVGIGTTSPSSKLNVSGGNICISNDTARLILQNSSTGSSVTEDGFQVVQDGVAAFLINYEPNQNLYIANNNSIYITVTSTGNVGVGTTTPSSKLNVSGGNICISNSTARLILQNNATGSDTNYDGLQLVQDGSAAFLINYEPNQNLYIANNNSIYITVTSTGNIGINNLEPGTKLDVAGDFRVSSGNGVMLFNNSGYLDIRKNDTVTFNLQDTNSLAQTKIYSNSDTKTYFQSYGDVIFAGIDSATIRGLCIATSGNLGVGTTNPNVEFTVRQAGIVMATPSSSGLVEFRGSQTSTVGESILRLGRGHHDFNFWASSAEFNIRRAFDSGTNAASAMDIRLGAGASDNPDTNIMTLIANGNVGISTTSPNYKLDVAGDINFTGTLYKNGNSFVSSQWTGSIGSVISYTGGNVGIGFTNPNVRLTVRQPNTTLYTPTTVGTVEFRGSASSAVGQSILRIGRATNEDVPYYGASAEFNLRKGYGSGTSADSAMDIRLGAGNSDNPDVSIMTLMADGTVGIGTTSPSSKFNVSGGNICISNNTARLILQNSTTGSNALSDGLQLVQNGIAAYLINYEPNQKLYIANNNTIYVTVTSTGNVGIGTENPSYKLQVAGNTFIEQDLYIGPSAGNSKIFLGGGVTGDGGYENSVIETRLYSGSEGTEMLFFKGNDNEALYGPDRIRLRAGAIVFDTYTSATTNRTAENIRMTIADNGNVGIGTTAPNTLLNVYNTNVTSALGHFSSGDLGQNGVLQIQSFGNNRNQDGATFRASVDGNYIISFQNTAGNVRGIIQGVNANSVAYGTTSDRRLKTNIKPLNSTIDIIKALQPVEYDWISDNTKDYGMIAQEVFKVLPNLRPDLSNYTDGTEFEEPHFKDGRPFYYTLDYSKFTPYIIKCCQELIDENTLLKNRLQKIEERLGL